MTANEAVKNDIAYLTANIKSSPAELKVLRSTIELALIKLGHDADTVEATLDDYYRVSLH